MHEAVPLYALKGSPEQSTDCACASADHPIPPTANSALTRPVRMRLVGRDAATQLPPRLPRARVFSDAATQAPRDSFQSER